MGSDAIFQVMKSRVGEEFDPAKIRADVKAVYRMGYFSDVKIDAEKVQGVITSYSIHYTKLYE